MTNCCSFLLMEKFLLVSCRLLMGVNGESMGRKWPKETHVLELIIGVAWHRLAQLENRYIIFDVHYKA